MIKHLHTGDKRRVAKLIKAECANYMDGLCLIRGTMCTQTACNEIWCRYFVKSVLPLDAALRDKLFTCGEHTKGCSECGRPFVSQSNRTKYCDECRKLIQRRQARIRSERRRLKSHAIEQ